MSGAPDTGTVKKALSAHAAIGLLAGALLYLVSLTGTIAVFYPELQRLEQPGVPEMQSIDPAAVQRGVQNVLAAERGTVPTTTTHLYVHLPTHELPRATLSTDTQAFHLHDSGAIAAKEEIAWSDFLVQLHYLLNLPALAGLTVVGALGVAMLVLSFSGVLALPRIFRDAFRLRARNSNGVALADWHNRLSVWTLPFTLAIALTGAVIGLSMLTAQTVAEADHAGDIEAVYGTIYGSEGHTQSDAAVVPNVAAALRHMAATYPDVLVSYAILHDPLTSGQHVQIVGEHERRLIFGEYYAFAPDGRFLHTAGLSDGRIGQQAAASVYKLHFGNFGGLPVKLAYFIFGVALTVVCATGVYIWLGKRRRRGFHEPALLAGWHAVVWGWPAGLALTALARLVVGNEAPFAAIFWTTAILVPVIAVAWKSRTPQPLADRKLTV